MKTKKLVWLFLLLVLAKVFAVPSEFQPNTVGEMTAEATLVSTIELKGPLLEGDWMEIKALSFQNSDNQKLEDASEELRLGNAVFEPEYRTEGENRFAVFTIKNLGQLGNNPVFELTIRAHLKTKSRIGLNNDFNLSSALRENTEFLQSSKFIESDAPELKSKAALEFPGDSELESIRAITEWVHNNITYDFEHYYKVVYSAQQTYHNRAGVCDEFANLTAAFLRIKGIPTRYVSGISFDGNRFGNHGWLEAFLPGTGWIGVDSTYGEAGYLDAAHIALGKGLDNSQIQNLLVSVHAIHPEAIQINSTIQEPQVSIRDLVFLQDLTKVKLQKPFQTNLNESFEIKAQIQNQLEKNVLFPATLLLHPDFSYSDKSRMVWLKPNETQEVSWQAVSPQTGKEGYYTKYEMFFELPDQKIKDNITVEPHALASKPGGVSIEDISPFISDQPWNNTLPQRKTLEVQITFQNSSSQDQNLSFEFRQNNQTKRFEKTIPAETKQTEQFSLYNLEPGIVELQISGALQKEYSIQIPTTENKKPEKTSITEKPAPPSNLPANSSVPTSNWFWDAIARFFQNAWNGIQQFFGVQ